MQFLPRIKQASDAVINITTGGGHGMTLEERLAAPLAASPEMCSLNMGSMNFGLYPDAGQVQGIPARVGARPSRELARLHLPQHLQGYRVHPARTSARRTARASSSSATTSAISTRSPIFSTASWSSRRSSCRASSASSAASAPIPRISRTASTSPTSSSATVLLVDPGRRPASAAARHHGRDHGRQCPRRARGFAVSSARASSPNRMPSRCAASAPSWRTSRSRSRRRRKRARCCRSRAATGWRSDDRQTREKPGRSGRRGEERRHRAVLRLRLRWASRWSC